MDDEIKNFIKVWILVLASLTYCYYISFNIPKGKIRLLSLVPVFYLFITLPLNLTTISLGGCTAFFLAWLANFKLLLFSFGHGPLCSIPSFSFPRFISIACFPVTIKNKETPFPQNTKSTSQNQEKPLNSKTGDIALPKTPSKGSKSPLNYATKGLVLTLLSLVYEHKQHLHPKLMLAYYCCYMYIALELVVTMVASIAGALIGAEIEPQFDEPYLATSLQDFWGRRWNRTVSIILRPTVYEPIRQACVKPLGTKWAQLPAVFGTFVVSGLMHELMFYYIGRVSPTWEVTCFFVVQGACLVGEIVVKKALEGRRRLHRVVSGPLTLGFVMVTGVWLFFPQLLRCNTDVRSSREALVLVNFVKDLPRFFAEGVRMFIPEHFFSGI